MANRKSIRIAGWGTRRSPEIPLERILRDVEGALIRISLQRTPSLDAAARILWLTPAALSLRMRRLGVQPPPAE